jgi:hypothetical protein
MNDQIWSENEMLNHHQRCQVARDQRPNPQVDHETHPQQETRIIRLLQKEKDPISNHGIIRQEDPIMDPQEDPITNHKEDHPEELIQLGDSHTREEHQDPNGPVINPIVDLPEVDQSFIVVPRSADQGDQDWSQEDLDEILRWHRQRVADNTEYPSAVDSLESERQQSARSLIQEYLAELEECQDQVDYMLERPAIEWHTQVAMMPWIIKQRVYKILHDKIGAIIIAKAHMLRKE